MSSLLAGGPDGVEIQHADDKETGWEAKQGYPPVFMDRSDQVSALILPCSCASIVAAAKSIAMTAAAARSRRLGE